jgi:hypothetical protein
MNIVTVLGVPPEGTKWYYIKMIGGLEPANTSLLSSSFFQH